MDVLFFISAAIAIGSSIMVVTRRSAVHALLYLVTSLLASAFIFYLLGASFIAALEVIIYAGAIMVLFIFVVMMLNLEEEQEKNWLKPGIWIGPSLLILILLVEYIIMLSNSGGAYFQFIKVLPKEVGKSLFTTYILGVEMAAMLLLAGIVGAYHLGKRKKKVYHRYLEESDE